MESKIIQIVCGNCGHTITSEYIYGSIAYCTACTEYKYKIVSNSQGIMKNVFYKIIRFESTDKHCREELLNFFYEHGDAKLFNDMKIKEDLKRYYLPVREIGSGKNRFYVPLNESHSELHSSLFHNNQLYVKEFNNILSEELFQPMNVLDFKPRYTHYAKDVVEFLPVNVSLDKIDALYGVDKNEMLTIKYIPLFTLKTTLCNFTCVGTGNNFYICDQENILKAITLKKKKSTISTIIGYARNFGRILGILACVALVGWVIYQYYTGNVGDSFWSILFNTIGFAFIAIWSVIWIGLYIIGFLLIISPLLLLTFFIKNSSIKVHPSMKKGRKLLNL